MAAAMETRLPCSQKLVLLVLCDRANDQGGSIWESVGEISRKSSLSDRQVQRTLRGFEALGLLRVTGHADGGAPGLSRRYRLDVATLDRLVIEAREADTQGAGPVDNSGRMADDELLFGSETGDTMSPVHTAEDADAKLKRGDMVSGGVTWVSPDPSLREIPIHPLTPVAGGKPGPDDSKVIHRPVVAPDQASTVDNSAGVEAKASTPKTGPICITTWLARCKAEGRKPIPEDDPVWTYAEQVGIPDEFIGLAWAEFKARRMDSGKRQRDYPQAFRNSVRGNWFRLWWTDGRTYSLTTQGQQAQALHREARTVRQQQQQQHEQQQQQQHQAAA